MADDGDYINPILLRQAEELFALQRQTIGERLAKLEEYSHEPVDIAPRIYDELDRMAILGRLFYEVPTNQLQQAAQLGLNAFNSTLAQDIRR